MKNTFRFIALAVASMGFGVVAEAQQPAKLPRIGLLTFTAPPPRSSPTPFEQGLRQLGYVEGQNITIERRYASGKMDRLPGLAVELARLPWT